MKPLLYSFTWIACALAAISLATLPAFGAPKSQSDATNAIQGWLKLDPHPFGLSLSSKIKKTETINDTSGKALYHVVHLSPWGFVVASADDTIEPIVAFSARGDFDASATQGLASVVNIDLTKRMAHVHPSPTTEREKYAYSKWQTLLAASPNPPPDMEISNYAAVVSEVMVTPFLKTSWNQQEDEGDSIDVYDYYVPPGPAGSTGNDPCGCVATAMAQVMYYFQYPTTGVGTGSYSYEVNGSAASGNLRGGDGNGGAYQWANMPLAPNYPTTAQAEEIGDLCYDAGISADMDYEPGGSACDDENVGPALQGTFFYSSSQYAIDLSGLAESNILNMINANIDARLPAMVGINGADGGHEILADGYGYIGATLFHHLNMGWGGADSIWYQLPVINTQDGNGGFTIVDSCVYNIYTNGTGMIISGRITDPTGAAVAGATVTAVGGGTYTATSDTNGIYGLINLPTSTTFTVTASLAGYTSVNGNFSTRSSASGVYVGSPVYSGNYWGANLVMTRPLLAMPESGFAAIGPVGGPFNMTSQNYTLSNSTAASISWAASTAPSWLTLSSSSGSVSPNGTASLSISLSAAAYTKSTGTNSATIWITNQTTHVAQGLQLSLVIAPADYPIAVKGFNDDVVVEASALGGNTADYADMFDTNNSALEPPTSFAFYESGLATVNVADYPPPVVPGTEGLPQSGYFTSAVDNKTMFQFGPYDGYNVLALSPSAPSGTLTLVTPLSYGSLSVLAATSEGGGTGSFVVNFTDGSSSPAMSFNASNYFCESAPTGVGAAISQFGLLIVGDYANFYVFEVAGYDFPVLYQTSATLPANETNKLVESITFTMPSGQGSAAETGVFAVSGTQSGASVGSSSGSGMSFGFITTSSTMNYSVGSFTLEVTNAAASGTVVISASTNLTSWTPIYTNTSGASSFSFTDTTARSEYRFYKASKN